MSKAPTECVRPAETLRLDGGITNCRPVLHQPFQRRQVPVVVSDRSAYGMEPNSRSMFDPTLGHLRIPTKPGHSDIIPPGWAE
jgi:hypothetical protein